MLDGRGISMAQQMKQRTRRSVLRIALDLESQFCEEIEDVADELGIDRSKFIRAALQLALDRHKSGQSIPV